MQRHTSSVIETRSLPTLAHCSPRSQPPVRLGPFYVAPSRSLHFYFLLSFPPLRRNVTESDRWEDPLSVESPSVQSAIVAAVANDRKRYGGHTPVPAALIGVWDGKGAASSARSAMQISKRKCRSLPADHFRIGSNTKTFVISALLQLVGEKKLSLDDPLSHFQLGVAIPNAENITGRELCNMRSGLSKPSIPRSSCS